jgi:hypothetical protein
MAKAKSCIAIRIEQTTQRSDTCREVIARDRAHKTAGEKKPAERRVPTNAAKFA